MSECPVCFGEGGFDERDCNALLREHLSDAQLALVPHIDDDFVDCGECEGTGVVTDERARDIRAAAVATVDQFIAAQRDKATTADI